MTRWALDTEFLEDGKTIELISIALVNLNTGQEYYAGNADCDIDRVRADEWLSINVMPHLPAFGRGAPSMPSDFWKPRSEIRKDLLRLFGVVRGEVHHDLRPEIWADHASYDWVVLCQIFGRMIDLPKGMPMYCLDLMQRLWDLGVPHSEMPQQEPSTKHSALEDARWLKAALKFVGR